MSSTIRPTVSKAGLSLKGTEEWEQITHGSKYTQFDRSFYGEKVFGLGYGNLHFNLKLKTDFDDDPYVIIKSALQEILSDFKIRIEYSVEGKSGWLTYNPKVESISNFISDCPDDEVFRNIFKSPEDDDQDQVHVTYKVTVEIKLKKTEMPTPKSNLIHKLSKTEMPMPKSNLLHKLYSDVELSDAKIHCGGKVFCCHKIILSGQSEVFKKTLFGNGIEATSGKIEITDISASAMENLLFYVYYEYIDGAKITTDLLVAANKYDISDLVNFCVHFLGNTLSEENVVDVMTAAFLTDQEELFELACKFVFKIRIDNQNVVETEAWKKLQEEKPILAFKMLNKALFKN